MNSKAFIDTNIFIYLYSKDELIKQEISQKIIEKYDCTISTQVINEFCNVCLKKFKKPIEEIKLALNEIIENCTISFVETYNVMKALEINKQYGYNYFDCLMIASALDSGCKYLITEDLADGQIIDKKLTIVNIFSRNNNYIDF
jgi:predicted nucleic acid-binding protein